ncbi:GNAT family N-acetyltransferase [Chitinophaga filiformis]|uniref:GNAT family N-acetyltransferase n=1 Tax=Chitinophaga filiformis TaxID=104663 RepID=UPI001F2151D2|nr:GNAT family N-acetyltransferase [Chitinophaga filiformis]MCF6402567.1 GNAT family N-acetyltransferase [Chitinophaga filiformis]MCF6403515.1 GNAT family N-acetyltransferase [Chitinophaga filiformis]
MIKHILRTDPLLEEVIVMGRKNARTLGMFPDGAFYEHAGKNCILGAIDADRLVGYLLFRIIRSNQLISITHLCIDSNYRNNGVAGRLVDFLRDKFQYQVKGITLTCREDYKAASGFWKKYGFKPVREKRGRNNDNKSLIKWRYDFGNNDLFSSTSLETEKIQALLDSNIIIKLRDEHSSENIEAMSLQADWLEDEVEYFYAQEIYNEINRDADKERAANTRKFIAAFEMVRFKPHKRDIIFEELKAIMIGVSENDLSDRLQMAECIASGLKYFITMDTGILDKSEEIYNAYNVRILRPLDFILFTDHLLNSKDYATYRVAGARYDYNKISVNDINQLVDVFWQPGMKEKKPHFHRLLSDIAVDVNNNTVKIVKDPQGNCLGIFAACLQNDHALIRIIRTRKGKIQDVLFQQLLYDICQLALKEKKYLIRISEDKLTIIQSEILQAFGFENKGDSWDKIVLEGQYLFDDVLRNPWVIDNSRELKHVRDRVEKIDKGVLDDLMLQVERRLWPLKFVDPNIPTYIIPIKSLWASQLFDHFASSQSLFGSRAELAWSKENIYYRSVKPVSEKAPARILWYVSEDPFSAIDRNGGIVACSYMDEVYTGEAKSLYQRFKNFGIYEWSDIIKMTGGNAYKEIKAIRFSDTEVFKKVISFKKICAVMEKCGRLPNSFASPVEVSKEVFNEIYKLSQQSTHEQSNADIN